MSNVELIAKNAKKAFTKFMPIVAEERNRALLKIATSLEGNTEKILKENQRDIAAAEEAGLSKAMIDRLTFTEQRINDMAAGVRDIAAQKEVIGERVSSDTRPNGLKVNRERVPLGVILMIFESRPNIVIDCAALAIKSGNAIILKGGKEALFSNQVLAEIVSEACANILPANLVQVLASNDRELVQNLLKQNQEIDVVIPRGGHGLVNYVYQNSNIPVIAHFLGLCHVYVDRNADPEKALAIALDSKLQRPGVCNAAETLLVHRDFPALENLIQKFIEHETVLFLDKATYKTYQAKFDSPYFKEASDDSFHKEYLDKKLSLRVLDSVEEAIQHITTHGSKHTETIVSEDNDVLNQFKNSIDASCIMLNTSTRFNDGAELGLGAEIGISTSKLHAYGPMGAAEMTTLRFVVEGEGQLKGERLG